jgi:hypothetical protein
MSACLMTSLGVVRHYVPVNYCHVAPLGLPHALQLDKE